LSIAATRSSTTGLVTRRSLTPRSTGRPFRLLQQRVPRYETYDVLDDNQLTAFLSREVNRLQVRRLDEKGRLFASIAAFLKSVDVVEN
jgi:hypothetical protein